MFLSTPLRYEIVYICVRSKADKAAMLPFAKLLWTLVCLWFREVGNAGYRQLSSEC